MKKLIIIICVLICQLLAKSQVTHNLGFGLNALAYSGGYYLNYEVYKQIDGRYYLGTGIVVSNLYYIIYNTRYGSSYPYSWGSRMGENVTFSSLNYEIPLIIKYDLVKNKLVLKSNLGLFVGDVLRYNYKFSSDAAEENYNRVNGLLWGKVGVKYGMGLEYWFLPRFGANIDLGGLRTLDFFSGCLSIGLKYQFWQKERS